MRVLLQHPHAPGEISGVLTYVENLRAALAPLGVEARVFSTHGARWRDLWPAVRAADLVHLNSNHLRLALIAWLRGKPVLIKYHFPFWGQTVEGQHEPRPLWRRLLEDARFRWRQGRGGGVTLKRVRFVGESVARSLLRVAVALLVRERTACSRFVAETTDLPVRVELDYNPFEFPPLAAPPEGWPGQRPCFLFAGRLHTTKGADLLLRAAARMAACGRVFRVELIGDGEELAALRALASELGLDSIVTFAGRQPREAVLASMARSLLVVVPSRWNDPAPYVVVEAAAMGRACVGSRMGGIPELVRADELLFENEDVPALAARLERLLDNPNEARRRGTAAYEALSRECAAPVAGARVKSVYARMLRQRG